MKHAKALGIHRKGLGFHCLRHVFATVGDGAKDPVAVTEHVRTWLFGQPARETAVVEPAAISFDPRPRLLAGLLSDLRTEKETE